MSVTLVNLGLPKSGTTTLERALRAAGIKAADHKVRRRDTGDPALGGTFVARQVYDGYFATGDPLARLDLYEALTEISALKPPLALFPQCDWPVVQAMRASRPGLRFVATRRPAADLAASMRRWTNLGEDRLPAGNLPGLPDGYGTTDAQIRRWIEGHYAMLRTIFEGDPAFLELPVAAPDARARLAAHIGRDLPWWGVANANPGSP